MLGLSLYPPVINHAVLKSSRTYREDDVENDEDIFAEQATSIQSHDDDDQRIVELDTRLKSVKCKKQNSLTTPSRPGRLCAFKNTIQTFSVLLC